MKKSFSILTRIFSKVGWFVTLAIIGFLAHLNWVSHQPTYLEILSGQYKPSAIGIAVDILLGVLFWGIIIFLIVRFIRRRLNKNVNHETKLKNYLVQEESLTAPLDDSADEKYNAKPISS